jgi:hypothetical protein
MEENECLLCRREDETEDKEYEESLVLREEEGDGLVSEEGGFVSFDKSTSLLGFLLFLVSMLAG